MALIVKYTFHDVLEDEVEEIGAENKAKKRKLTSDLKRNNVLEYSKFKLPANVFGLYLKTDSQGFLDDCER